ncbi:MAG: tRNA pseudouridine(38-40) synthase TruA [Candidatus Thorarchaeota archaeon]|nr:tRNA pseudouridine(38-40) synthase TruA [Candidatus Thorarchaeota archaeon]
MTAFLARLFYFGDGFHGSQVQPGLRTVQGELISAISRWSGEPHDTKTVRLSGRTDRGVHSIGQVVMINTDMPFSVMGINKHLPPDMGLWAFCKIHNEFNPRHDVLSRYYRYYLPHNDDFDISLMQKASQLLVGVHDFKFLSKRDGLRPTTTTLLNVAVIPTETSLKIEVHGTSFLWKLVRNIASLLLLVGRHQIDLDAVNNIVHAKARLASGIRPAPPEALFLMESVVPFHFILDKYGVRRMQKIINGRLNFFRRFLVALTSLSAEAEEQLRPV